MPKLPCLNPNCKSHGKPHPNCRCYGPGVETFSSGGKVGYFCDSARDHKEGCEYYASSGIYVDPNELSDKPPTEPQYADPSTLTDKPVEDSKYVDPATLTDKPGGEPEYADPSELTDKPENGIAGFHPIDTAKAFIQAMPEAVMGKTLSQKAMSSLGDVKIGGVQLGDTLEEVKRLEAEHPTAHDLGYMTAYAIAGSKLAAMNKGRMVLNNAMLAFTHNFADATGKALLGDETGGDIEGTVSNAIADTGMEFVVNVLSDAVLASPVPAGVLKSAKKALEKWAEKPITHSAIAIAGKYFGSDFAEEALKAGEYGTAYKLFEKTFGKTVDDVLHGWYGKAVSIDKRAGEAVLHALNKMDFVGLGTAIKYAEKVSRGETQLSNMVKSIFKSGYQSDIFRPYKDEASGAIKSIKEWVDLGGVDEEIKNEILHNNVEPSKFSKGGKVEVQGQGDFGRLYPAHNMILSMIKARTSNYLRSIKPYGNQPKLAFDKPTPQKDKEREYDLAVSYAARPLSILNKVNNGTLTPNDMKHFMGMFPEVHSQISKEMTKYITEAQMKGERPAYKKRQAMSLFLGADLDSTFTPQAISSIQMMYANKNAVSQPQMQSPKKSTSSLSKTSQYFMTDEQARMKREQSLKP